jgi:hypothetical protein
MQELIQEFLAQKRFAVVGIFVILKPEKSLENKNWEEIS